MVQSANLQALVARRTGKPLYAVLLFRLNEPASARDFLKGLLPRIISGDMPEANGTPLLNVFMSWRALSTLLTGHPRLDPAVGRRQLEPFFTDPTQAPDSPAMADQLGFAGRSAPAHWWASFRTEDIDLAIYAGCDNDQQRKSVLAELRSAAAAGGLSELIVPSFPDRAIAGYRPAGGRLHFGYRDGITTSDVDWDDTGRPGAVNLREFVLGYWTEDYPTAPYPAGPWRDFARDGSFACLTWIYQDVAGFEAFLSRYAPIVAPSLPAVDSKEWLAAKLMGRWRDGTPLARHPDLPPPAPDLDDAFGYADDPTGARCPIRAHVRVAYSRDQSLSFANQSRFPGGPPRLIRRGFSYGEPLVSSVDDGKDRGLFGVFMCARINEQFYTILRWMQQTDFSGVFDGVEPGRAGQDRLTGSRLPGGGNRTPKSEIIGVRAGIDVFFSLPPFIQYKGVAVLLAPSISSLNDLAAK